MLFKTGEVAGNRLAGTFTVNECTVGHSGDMVGHNGTETLECIVVTLLML